MKRNSFLVSAVLALATIPTDSKIHEVYGDSFPKLPKPNGKQTRRIEKDNIALVKAEEKRKRRATKRALSGSV